MTKQTVKIKMRWLISYIIELEKLQKSNVRELNYSPAAALFMLYQGQVQKQNHDINQGP